MSANAIRWLAGTKNRYFQNRPLSQKFWEVEVRRSKIKQWSKDSHGLVRGQKSIERPKPVQIRARVTVSSPVPGPVPSQVRPKSGQAEVKVIEHWKMETATNRHRSKHIRIRKNKTTSRLVLLPRNLPLDLPRFYHNLSQFHKWHVPHSPLGGWNVVTFDHVIMKILITWVG